MACVVALVLATGIAAEDTVRFFEETGHSIDNQHGFLDFWDQHEGTELLGPPITGVILAANVPVQYFERGRLEFRDQTAIAGALGRERTRWRDFPAARTRGQTVDTRYYPETEHTLAGEFLRFWDAHHGALMFGAPLSEPLWELVDGASLRVQYFERARLEQQSSSAGGGIRVSALGREIALAQGLMTPEQRIAVAISEVVGVAEGSAAFGELAPPTPTPIPPSPTQVPPTPTQVPPSPTLAPPAPTTVDPAIAEVPTIIPPSATPIPATATPEPEVEITSQGGKEIVVDLAAQWLTAYEDGVPVFKAPVATGKDGFRTPPGTFTIYHKLKLRTMRGDSNGESWTVPNVPNVMYINGGVALHGTYWHDKFGSGVRMSHGCVNLSLADAAWLYDWAPMNTRVVVHE